MSLWRRLARGLSALANRSAADRDEADEVRHYLEQAAEAHRARGLPPDAALRAARLELGGETGVREQLRLHGWENAVDALLADLRFACRRLAGEPAFTAAAALTLALGIGGTTAIFSAVNPILFQPLPYPDAGRIAMIWDVGADGSRLEGAYGSYRELAERARTLENVAVMRPWQPTLQGAAEPERLDGQRVSAAYFDVLGVPPRLGRSFQPADDRPGAPAVVILGAPLWRRRFGGDPGIVGRTVTLDGAAHLVVGVMPPEFENVPAPAAAVWTPLRYDMSLGSAWGHHLRTVARVRPGTGLDDARRELDRIASAPVPEFPRPPWAALANGLTVVRLQDDVTRGVRPALLAVAGAVVLVLLIACVNVTNLLLARGVRRREEFALRAALGAGHDRLVRQLLTESLLLGAIGGLAGMAVAALGVRALVALSPPGLPRAGAIALDGGVLAFGVALTTLVGLLFGTAPALQAARNAPRDGIQHRGGRGRHPARRALVVAEVALASMLLVGAGLLLRSLDRLFAVDAGLAPAGLLTLQVQASGPRLEDDAARRRFFGEALAAVRRVPGVTAAALTSQLPLSGDLDLYGVHLDPAPPGDPGEAGQGTFRYAVSPGYVEAMGIRLLRGRSLEESDRAGAPRAALVSTSLASRRFPGLDPIGRRLRIGALDGPPFTIVGVVGDVRQVSLALEPLDAVYTTAEQWHFPDRAMSLVVRGTGGPESMVPAVRRAIWSADPDQAVVRVASMEDVVAASAAERRFALILFEAFGLSALLLAAAGIYGVLAGSVAERTREIGVRSALGASRGGILALVLREGMALTGLGIVAGVLGAAAATRGIAALLYGVSPLDPVTYLGVVALLAGVALAACGVPAWRAARVDPASTLRSE